MSVQPVDREAVVRLVDDALERARGAVARRRRLNLQLTIASVVFGTVGTVFAGGSAATGSVSELFGSWRVLCFAVAVCTAIGTMAGLLQSTLKVADRLAQAVSCVARLQSVRIALTIEGRDYAELADDYRRTLEEYADCLV